MSTHSHVNAFACQRIRMTRHLLTLHYVYFINQLSVNSECHCCHQVIYFSVAQTTVVAMAIKMADKLLRPLAALVSASSSSDTVGSYTSVWSNLGKRTTMRVASVGSTFGNPSSMSNQAPESTWYCKRTTMQRLGATSIYNFKATQ